MEQNTYKSIEELLDSGFWEWLQSGIAPEENTRVLYSNRLDDAIYTGLRDEVDIGLDEIEAEGELKLDTFAPLLKDVFHSLYNPHPLYNDVETLTPTTSEFNAVLLDYIVNDAEYPVLKSSCEGQELPAYEATKELSDRILRKLDEMLDSDILEEINALEEEQSELKAKVKNALEGNDPADEDGILDMAEAIAANEQEIERLSLKINRSIRKNKDVIQSAVTSAAGKAQMVSDVIKTWGNGDSSPQAIQQNTELLRRVQSSQHLPEIIKYLGRYREILDNARKSRFTYGRGDKYDIELGNDITRALSSEYAYLAQPELIPFFIRKVQQKRLKQYRKRERTTKGYGDLVVCIDESASMSGDPIAWAKAVALVLLEYATKNNRGCAMVRFASDESQVIHIFRAGEYTIGDVFSFAESFLCGGTDFEIPLRRAVTLIEDEGFENADIMFITDGACEISDEFANAFREKKKQLKFKVTGILIDVNGTDMDFSLTPFCEKVYHMSEMVGDEIASDIITSLVI